MRKISLFVLIIILFAINNINAQTTRYVNQDGLCGGNSPCYTSIQAAITASVSGDIIQVSPGTYSGNININKSNITLISAEGSLTTILNGNSALSGSATIYITSGISGVRIGSPGHGFKIVGIDGTAAVEKAAVYLLGTHSNITIEDNIIQANGDAALMGANNANCNNIVINNNKFTGQTFNGVNPAGVGSSAQFTLLNVPRQAVVFGGGTSTTLTRDFSFTNNEISTITGGMSITSNTGTAIAPTAQGNSIVTLDLVGNNIITGNTFSGYIGTYTSGYALRVRGSGVYTVENNIFNGNYYFAIYTNNALAAPKNYWGSPKGPNSSNCAGLKYNYGTVTYEPWYSDTNLTTLAYKLIAYNVTGTTAICSGNTTNVSLSNSQNGNNYQYQVFLNGSTAIGNPISGSGSMLNAAVSSVGTYTIKATNTHSTCELNMTANAVITTKVRPTANITGGSNNTVVIALSGTSPWTGHLSDGTTFNSSSSPITVNVTPNGTTTYTVSSLSDANCNSQSADLTGSHTIVAKVETPVFSPVSGIYYNPKNITISTSTNGAHIRYTTDGSTPDANNGIDYTNQVLIGANTLIKAIALKNGMTNSEVAESYYEINIDTDNDGVVDSDDEYPTDSTRAFNNFSPAKGLGTLAFEDSWPSKGDYDMNDVVVDYQFKNILNANEKLVETYATFVLKASGAGYNNGFGFQFKNNTINQSDITVSGYFLNADYINLNSNGTEANQSKPTIIVFDNAYSVLQHPGVGTGINTTMGLPYVNPVTLTIHIIYTPNSYNEGQLDISHFNPFIIINKNREKEVHLADNSPTSLADLNLFGTQNDNSNAVQNRYYKTTNNLPWALNIYETFSYPVEKAPINEAYNHFIDWVISNGESYTDWYKDNTGNRNTNKIFIHQSGKTKKE